jgi:hypothetical protein
MLPLWLLPPRMEIVGVFFFGLLSVIGSWHVVAFLSLFLRVFVAAVSHRGCCIDKNSMRREAVGTGRGWLNCSQRVGCLGLGAHRPHPHCALGRFALRTVRTGRGRGAATGVPGGGGGVLAAVPRRSPVGGGIGQV